MEAGGEQIQFKADGTIEGTDEFGCAVRGRYEHLSATRLRMTLSVRSTNEGGAVAVDNSTGDCEVRVREDQGLAIRRAPSRPTSASGDGDGGARFAVARPDSPWHLEARRKVTAAPR